MAILRTLSLLLVCFALVSGSVANAAMPCCMGMDAPAMQMDSGMDMPCHQKADKDGADKAKSNCDGCGCMHCVKMSAAPEQPAAGDEIASAVKIYGTQSIHSRQPDGVFQPPKQLS